jgi:ferrochelatase
MSMKIAVVLFNLGGPDTPEAIRPFLQNLFSDKRIITAPAPIRWFLARLISTTRAPKVKPLYAEMGGASPILPNTLAQAEALEALLNRESGIENREYKAFLAMRYWHPFASETIEAVKAYGADQLVLLPLYPQFSTTTTESSVVEWNALAQKQGLTVPTSTIGCYFTAPEWIEAEAALLKPLIEQSLHEHPNTPPRIFFSAHGLPQKIIDQKGDPYVWQIQQTAKAIVKKLDMTNLDWLVTYQSRVGPVEWVKPYTDVEIRKAGAEGKPIILAPIAFVSEHIETLVELDVENKHLAMESGCIGYYRAPTVSTHPLFISALAHLVRDAAAHPPKTRSHEGKRLCPPEYTACICR